MATDWPKVDEWMEESFAEDGCQSTQLRGRLRSDSGYTSAPLSPVKSANKFVTNGPQLTPEENFWLMRTAKNLAILQLGSAKVIVASEQSDVQDYLPDCRWESDPNRFDQVVMLKGKPQKKSKKPILSYCQFCKNNNEADKATWSSHICKDEYNRVICPFLSNYVCPYCKATGFNAHTIRYCVVKKEADLKKLEDNFKKFHC